MKKSPNIKLDKSKLHKIIELWISNDLLPSQIMCILDIDAYDIQRLCNAIATHLKEIIKLKGEKLYV